MRNQSMIPGILLLTALLFLPTTAGAGAPDTSGIGTVIYPAIGVNLINAPAIMGIKQLHLRANQSGDLIIAAATPGKNGDNDIIVARVDPDDATVLSWMTIGGKGDDWVGGLILDRRGRIIITGSTDSPDFPMIGGGLMTPPPKTGGKKAFLCRISPDLKTLEQSSTPVAGDGLGLALGKDGSIYMGGRTITGIFPEKWPGATPALSPGPNGFILRVNQNSWQVANATFIGGRGIDWVKAIIVNKIGDLVAVGDTDSIDFPFSEDAWQPRINSNDNAGFAVILDPELKKIKTATAINAGQTEVIHDLSIGRNDSVIITGWTSSPNFPSTRGDSYHGNGDCFVVRLSSDLTKLEDARIFGGKGMDAGRALVNEAGTFIVVAMESKSPRITGIKQPLTNPGGKDIDLLFLGPNLKLLRPEYSGTDLPDYNPALALGIGNRIILTGIAAEKGKARLFLSEHNLY